MTSKHTVGPVFTLQHAFLSRQCLQERKEDDMDMDVDEEPMRIVRNYQRHG